MTAPARATPSSPSSSSSPPSDPNPSKSSPPILADHPSNKSPISEVTALRSPSSPIPPVPPSHPTGLPLVLLITNLCAVLVVVSLDGSIVSTAVPSITDHFHTVADVGWYSSAFRLCICAFQFIFGKAYTLFSAKKIFILSNLISLLGFLICATAGTSGMLVAGRAVAGLGCSGLVAGVFTILVYAMPLRKRPMIIGVFCGVESISIVAAPLLGGVITQTLGWRWCFWITMPLGAMTIGLTVFCLRDDPEGDARRGLPLWEKIRQLDLLSILLFLPALTLFFLALEWAGTKYPWKSAAIVTPLCVSGGLLVAFVYNQYRLGDAAALSLRILGNRSVWSGFVYISCSNGALVVVQYYLPTYYQIVRGYTPAHSGTMMLPIIIAGSIANIILGWGIGKTGYYAPWMLFSSVIMPVAAGLITTFGVDSSIAKLILYTAFFGFANGIGFSGPQTAPQAALPKEDVSMGLAIILFAQSFGPAVAVAVAQVLFAGQLTANLRGLVPGFDERAIGSLGLKGIVDMALPGKELDVLVGVNKSIAHTWYLAVGLACATMIGSVLIEWKSVKETSDNNDDGGNV